MTTVLAWIFKVIYILICCTVVVRGILMFIAYAKLPQDVRKGKLADFALSILVEIVMGGIAVLAFPIARVGLIPVVLLCMGLYFLRKVLPFERVATQCIYSLMISWRPGQQTALAKGAAMHLF